MGRVETNPPSHAAAATAGRAAPIPAPQAANRQFASRRLWAALIALVISAAVFCVLVVRERDNRVRVVAMAEATRVAAGIQAYLNEWHAIPHLERLPPEAQFAGGPGAIRYPGSSAIQILREHQGPFVLVTGLRQGMVLPGGDGAAAVICDHGRVFAQWLTDAQIRAEQTKRNAILGRP
jgi:hypothetical protein